MKKILFFIPINRTYVVMPPIGLGYLATISMDKGYDVDILNCLKENMDYDDFKDFIRKNPADIFGISMMTYDVNSVKKHISIIKDIYPKSIIILGGAHPSGDYGNILIDYPDVDFAFRGESEIGFSEFLDVLSRPENEREYLSVSNLVWRDKLGGGKVNINHWSVINDLDSIKFPAWDLIDPREYPKAPHGAFAMNFPIAPIVITRGCPFQCTFCSGKTVTGEKIRKRTIPNVIEEIKMLIDKYSVKEIHIEDENFTLHKSLVLDFCNSLIDNEIKISWACPAGVRLDTLDSEMLDIMQKSGCHSLSVGVEFGSERIHKLTKKSLNLDLIKDKLELLSNYKIKVTGFFLMGIPGETKEDMIKTINFAKKLKIQRAQFNNFMPLPGSEIYNNLRAQGKLSKLDTDHFFVHDVGFVPEGMTKEDIKYLQRKAYLSFYLRPSIFFGLAKDIISPGHFVQLIKRFLDALK